MGNTASLSTEPDPATGLSARDRHLIKESWAEIASPEDIKDNGVELFKQLFLNFPNMKKYFSRFGDFDANKIGEIPAFRAHALGAMAFLSTYVQNLHDGETLVALVNKLVDSHLGRGITLKDFQDLNVMFVPYLRSLMGKKRVTPEIEEAWMKLLGAQSAICEARAKELGL